MSVIHLYQFWITAHFCSNSKLRILLCFFFWLIVSVFPWTLYHWINSFFARLFTLAYIENPNTRILFALLSYRLYFHLSCSLSLSFSLYHFILIKVRRKCLRVLLFIKFESTSTLRLPLHKYLNLLSLLLYFVLFFFLVLMSMPFKWECCLKMTCMLSHVLVV